MALPMFSRMRQDRPAFRKTYLDGTRLVATYALPAGAGLALLSEPLVRLICGDKWTGMETILAVLALYSGLGHLWALNADTFKAMGRPDIMPKLYAVQLLVMVPALFASAHYGLLWLTITRSLVVFVGALPHTFLAVRAVGVPANYLCQSCRHQIGATVLMSLLLGIVLYFSPFRFSSAVNWLMLMLMVVAGALTYLGSLFVFDKTFVQSVYALAKRSIISGYESP
jgi:O-antigen/teichoic acid export membrane protein